MTAPTNRSCDEPIIGGNGKPSRAARRAANRAKKDAAVLLAWAETERPAGLSLENRAAPSVPLVTGLETAKERRDIRKEERQHLVGIGMLERGRPSECTGQEQDAICSWIQGGGSLRSYQRSTGRAVETVYRWMRENASFQARLATAREDQSDTMAEEMVEIADEAASNPTIEGVAAAKLRVETRKWIASKLRPQKWGDKQVVEHVGAVSIRIGIPQKPAITVVEQVERLD